FHKSLPIFLVCLSAFLSSSLAHTFYVGDKDGWVLKPSEDYNQWAETNRFSVNDTLVFKYEKGSDSVLLVQKDDYYKCNTKDPIKTMDDGDSKFKFDNSGLFFFISGKEDHCQKEQKLLIIVMTPKSPSDLTPSPSESISTPAPAPSPSSATVTTSP
ncbi:Cu_bind_like domain-containing protein, partial [Cephalotus follicularis]